MKKLVFLTAAFLLVFVIGCQENPITEPHTDNFQQANNETNTILNVEKDISNSFHGKIDVNDLIPDPSQYFNGLMEVKGTIIYTLQVVQTDPHPSLPQSYIVLNYTVKLELQNPFTPEDITWTVSGVGKAVRPYSGDGRCFIINPFAVQGHDKLQDLVIKLCATHKCCELDAMWLTMTSAEEVVNH